MERNNTARDVFMYLLVVIVLAMSAVNLGTLLFQYVNVYVPDLAITQCSGTSCAGSIRWALASLIVVFPILLWAWRFLQNDIKNNPEKVQARVRRWLLYFTLFVAGVTIIGDAVSLIFSWLQGELTVQFLLKVLIVLYISGTLFFYFLRALHPKEGSTAKVVGRFAIGVVVTAVVVGFVTSGSPFRARLERLDSQRVSDLQSIQNQIVYSYWMPKGVLPATLADLTDSINGYVVPVDPQTKESYEYIRKGDRAFALCATFTGEYQFDNGQTRMVTPAGLDGINDSWLHGAGLVCFERTIDPQLYPIKQLQ